MNLRFSADNGAVDLAIKETCSNWPDPYITARSFAK